MEEIDKEKVMVEIYKSDNVVIKELKLFYLKKMKKDLSNADVINMALQCLSRVIDEEG